MRLSMKARCAVLLFLVFLIMMPSVDIFAQADGSGLASLTVSPNPDLWSPGPVGPEGREYQGKFRSAPIPETITVTAVTQNPGATFTINGQPGVSGEPMALHWDKWTPWLYLNVEITDPDGNNGQCSIILLKDIYFSYVGVDTGVWG